MPKKSSNWWGLAGVLVMMAGVYWLAKNIHVAEMLVENAGIMGPIVVILLYGIFAPTPMTTDPLTVMSGGLFGPLAGTIVSWMGNNLATWVEYVVGARIGNIAGFDKLRQKLPFGLGKLPVESPIVLIFGRMIPGYGGKIISIMGGMYKVPKKRYAWTSAITNLAGSILLSYGGYNLVQLLK